MKITLTVLALVLVMVMVLANSSTSEASHGNRYKMRVTVAIEQARTSHTDFDIVIRYKAKSSQPIIRTGACVRIENPKIGLGEGIHSRVYLSRVITSSYADAEKVVTCIRVRDIEDRYGREDRTKVVVVRIPVYTCDIGEDVKAIVTFGGSKPRTRHSKLIARGYIRGDSSCSDHIWQGPGASECPDALFPDSSYCSRAYSGYTREGVMLM